MCLRGEAGGEGGFSQEPRKLGNARCQHNKPWKAWKADASTQRATEPEEGGHGAGCSNPREAARPHITYNDCGPHPQSLNPTPCTRAPPLPYIKPTSHEAGPQPRSLYPTPCTRAPPLRDVLGRERARRLVRHLRACGQV